MGAPAGIATDRIVWSPDEATVEAANVTRLMRAHGIADLADLQRRSQDPDWFWPAAIADLGLSLRRGLGSRGRRLRRAGARALVHRLAAQPRGQLPRALGA